MEVLLMKQFDTVYIAQSSMVKNLYKIGATNDPYQRESALYNQGSGLELCSFKDGDHPASGYIEKMLHYIFNHVRLPQSEWFKLTKKQAKVVTDFIYLDLYDLPHDPLEWDYVKVLAPLHAVQ